MMSMQAITVIMVFCVLLGAFIGAYVAQEGGCVVREVPSALTWLEGPTIVWEGQVDVQRH